MDPRLFGGMPDQYVRTFRTERDPRSSYRKRVSRRRGGAD